MRILLICDAGDGLLDLALRAQALGHKVRFFLRKFDPRTRPIGVGLVERVDDWRAHMDWADLVVLESNGKYMAEMTMWQERGCKIIGGSAESAAWELDRAKGMSVFKKAGIAVPSYREFNDYTEAIQFTERRGIPFYSKPCSDTADKSLSAKTGVSENPAWMLRKWKKKHGRPPCPFLLQEAIEGVEFAVGAWFGPGGFSDDGYQESHEHKKLFAGDVGPNCGESGTVMRYVRRSKIAQKVLEPLSEELYRLGYVGYIDVNSIIADGHPWPLEFTARNGYPCFNIELSMLDCDPCEFLMALACGESTKGAHRMNEPAVGVVMALPPYPNSPRDYDEIVGVPLYGDLGEAWHPCEMQAGEDGAEQASAGGYLGVATGTGDTVRQAARRAYRVLDHLSMPASPFWRDDIGERLRREIPLLNEHGFAVGLEY
jgi:phosphoribosylamine---glycine ligase